MARRIDDMSSWVSSDGQPSMGCKTKTIESMEGAGAVNDYPDTQEQILSDQKKSVSKIKSNVQKSGYRN